MTSATVPQNFLLIEDDAFLADMHSMKFSAAGHTLKVASSGEQALEILREGYEPAAMIFDLVMPNMDGFALMDAINKEGLKRKSIFIVLSNQGEKEDIERARALGAVGHLVKANMIPSEVLATVEQLVEKHGTENL